MGIFSAIGKFIKFIFKSVFKIVWWVIKGFFSPLGLLIRLLVIGGIAAAIIFLF